MSAQPRFARAVALGFLCLSGLSTPAPSACCYFSAKGRDVLQPAQKVFITWDPDAKRETFTVQPKFEGNATDFGMVIPTPAQPKLDEMPRDFFTALAIFTILEPMDEKKFRLVAYGKASAAPMAEADSFRFSKAKPKVEVLESGIVGNLDYKIIKAEDAADLFTWLKDNKYSYKGDEETLDFYIKKKWIFTVMKIDPKQMRQGKLDDRFAGEVTPTRFSFAIDKPVYPLRITRISVKDQTEALFYIQAPTKMDFTDRNSFQWMWQPMWLSAMDMAVAQLMTAQEKEWQAFSKKHVDEALKYVMESKSRGYLPPTLEWAKKLTEKDIAMASGTMKFNRESPAAEVAKMKCLAGHIKEGQFITKIHRTLRPEEMSDDLTMIRAGIKGRNDDIEYYQALPSSPP